MLPDVLGGVEFGAGRRNRQQRQVFRDLQLVGRMPGGAIQQHDRMRVGRNGAGDLVEVFLHRQGVADIAGGTDRAEQIRALAALIRRLARAASLLRPLVDEAFFWPARLCASQCRQAACRRAATM